MRKIEVVTYDSKWESAYQEEATILMNILGDNGIAIFHIGSTAVPGLPAKPILDIMPIVKDLAAVDACQKEFENIGYAYMGEFGIMGRRFMKKGGEKHRSHHIHIFRYDNTYDILRHLAFTTYLVYHPEDREEYAKIKVALAAQFSHDIDGYCAGKDSFIKEVEKKALQWYFKTFARI